jgi:UDP-N-acetylmuramate dehydrogenase
MNWWRDFADQIQLDAPLARLTWYRLGGRARYLFRPSDASVLARLLRRANDSQVPVKILGAGANVLIRDDGFDGVVVRLDREAFRSVERMGARLRAGAGVDLMSFSRRCSEEGLSGMEGLAGIPASIGGAVRMNAGGRFGEIGDVVDSVTVLSREGDLERWSHERIGFAYRSTNLGDLVVLSADFVLTPAATAETSTRFAEYFAYKQSTQPLADKSAGCIFKNPPGQSAGALIDRAGLKGTRCGAAHVSERHANFIVADRGARSADVLHLIDLVRERVRTAFGTELQVEIDIW